MVHVESVDTRSFTLKELVDYCKNCVDWNDAKSIVAMLYKFIRNGTDEEQALVDSIEKEFNNRRFAYTYVNQQTVIPNVGNYQPQIKHQNIGFPAASKGQKGNKHINK